ncbi:MAG: YveK family protein [Anaerolineae bacterium]
MELRDYARILLKRGWIIVLVAFVAATSALIFSKFFVTPEYRSSVRLTAKPARPGDYGSGLAIKNVLWNLSEQLRSDEVVQEAANRLQLDLPLETLRGRITTDPDEARFIIRIDAWDYDPLIAKDIAQTFAQVFVEKHTRDNLEVDQRDRILVDILNNAKYGERIKPKNKVNTLAGGILGILLGGLIAFGLEYVEAGTVHSAEDVERYVGVPVLGAIPATGSGEALAVEERRPWWQVWHRVRAGGVTYGR